MHRANFFAALGVLIASPAVAQSTGTIGGGDPEIALLKQQLKNLELKIDRLQKQGNATAATAARASINAKTAEAKATSVANAKGPVAPSGAVVTMPNNRPTICSSDLENCIAITS